MEHKSVSILHDYFRTGTWKKTNRDNSMIVLKYVSLANGECVNSI